MDPYDHLFSDNVAQDDNDGVIPSDDDDPGDEDPEGNDDVAGPSKPIKLEPKKKVVRNPRNTLNEAKLCGPRGIIALKDHFKNFKFRGKGHEADDLNRLMRQYEHWAHRMFPKYHFDDCVAKIEHLGKKKLVQQYMNKYRSGLLHAELTEAAVNRSDESDDDGQPVEEGNRLNQPLDPLDSMLDEQIALSRGRTSLANTSGVGYLAMDTAFDAMRQDQRTPDDESDGTNPQANALKDTQRQAPKPAPLNEDIRAKIEANRLKAMELRKARLLALSQGEPDGENVENDSCNVREPE